MNWTDPLFLVVALAAVVIVALAGAELRVRRGQARASLSVRSIIRTLCGHRPCNRRTLE